MLQIFLPLILLDASVTCLHAFSNKLALAFPVLDSFPKIYGQQTSNQPISVNVSLSTDTSISTRLKNMRGIVTRAVGFVEREALGNVLGEMAEAYEEGWDSGSDEDDD